MEDVRRPDPAPARRQQLPGQPGVQQREAPPLLHEPYLRDEGLAVVVAVNQAVVVSVPDADGLDEPVACAVLLPGTTARAEDLVAWCREGLAAFKRPRHVLLFDELPQTATGKLQRLGIREPAVERLSS